MQGLVVAGLTVEKIWSVHCVKVTGAQNIGQGHQVKDLPSQGDVSCKI